MRTRSWKGLAATISVSTVIATGCGSDDPEPLPLPPPPTRIEATLAAAADVNPDIEGRPAPVVVRLYELAADTSFGNADFFQLNDDDATVLGADLVARSEYVLVPGETVRVSKTLSEDVRFLGATAAYQAIEMAAWRALMPVPANQTTTLTVAVGRIALSFADVSSVDASKPDKKDKKK